MNVGRTIERVRTLPAPSRGQFGPDHTVVEVIRPGEWNDADPFILLMDDRIDGRLMAAPHPHAGFETVTFIVEGTLLAEHQGGEALGPGDVEWTTAGSGIVHGPDAPLEGRFRVLQLWVALPKAERWTEPDHQIVHRADALVRREPGVEVRLYSGTSGGLASPTRNRVPITLLDAELQPGAAFVQELPASHNGFVYPLAGEMRLGADALAIGVGQVGWLGGAKGLPYTALRVANDTDAPARALLYAGRRQDVSLVWHGPFIGDSREDIVRSFQRWQAGEFRRV